MASVLSLSDDLLVHCLSFAGRRGLASAALVCRRWAEVCRSSALWRDVLGAEAGWPDLEFSETVLSRGLAGTPGVRMGSASECEETPGLLPQRCSSSTLLPWPTIMRTRMVAPRAIIIDSGSGYCKFGWSTDLQPRGRIAMFLEFGSMESPLLPRIHTLFRSIFASLDADPREHPVLITEPLCHLQNIAVSAEARMALRDATFSVLLRRLRVPAVCALSQAHLALFSAHLVSGLAVNIGFKVTTVVPIVQGLILPDPVGLEVVQAAAMRVTGCLHSLLEFSGIECQNMFTIRTLKEKLCQVALDRRDLTASAECASYTVPEEEGGGGTYTLGAERFLAPEVLFDPPRFGLPCRGIQEAVRSCLLRCAKLHAELQSREEQRRLEKVRAANRRGQGKVEEMGPCRGSSADHAGREREGEASSAVPDPDQSMQEGDRVPSSSLRAPSAPSESSEPGTGEGAGSPQAEAEAAGGTGDWEGFPGAAWRDAEGLGAISAAEVKEAMRNVVLCGGTAAIPGMAERLEMELRKVLPEDLSEGLRVHSNPYGYNCAWLGGRLLAQTSTFTDSWCATREHHLEGRCDIEGSLALGTRLKLRR